MRIEVVDIDLSKYFEEDSPSYELIKVISDLKKESCLEKTLNDCLKSQFKLLGNFIDEITKEIYPKLKARSDFNQELFFAILITVFSTISEFTIKNGQCLINKRSASEMIIHAIRKNTDFEFKAKREEMMNKHDVIH